MVNGTAETRQKILFILANILSNSKSDVAAVVTSGITSNIALALNDFFPAVRTEALWALSTLLNAVSDVTWLVDQFELESTLLEFLNNDRDPKNLILALYSFKYLLEKGGSRTRINFERMGGLDALENLQMNGFQEVSDKCVEIIEAFFADI
jgi:hypothetical protein